MNVNLSRYQTSEIGIQNKKSGYVPNGSDNLFPNYLNGLFNNSPTHQCIVEDLTGYTIGLGLKAENDEDSAKLQAFLNKRYLKKIVQTKYIHSAICLEVIRDGLNRVKEINCIDPSQIRVKEIENGKPTVFAFKKDWNGTSRGGNKEVCIPAYSADLPQSLFYWYDSGTFDVPYGRPSYISGSDAIELEISIYMMHSHGAQNGMFPSMVISKETSGDAEKDELDTIRTQEQVSGVSNAGKIITTYYQAGGNAPTFSTPNLSGLDKIYESQYETSESGILKAHRIPSSSLIAGLNVKPTGFASPEDEMQWAKNELNSKIIEPCRETLLDILKPIFSAIDIDSEVYFEDPENDNEIIQDIEVEETKEELSAPSPLDEFIGMGEDRDSLKDWSIVSVMEVDYDLEDQLDLEIQELNKPFVKLASTGVAFPNANSEQDGEKGNVQYKVRYQYAGDSTGQREFCSKMLSADKLYRKEDIIRMGDKPVNAGLGIRGAATYPIWEWKGGKYCHHKWERVTFVREGLEGSIDTRNPNAKTLTESQADERNMNPRNPKIVSTRPIDTPSRGAYTLSAISARLKKLLNNE